LDEYTCTEEERAILELHAQGQTQDEIKRQLRRGKSTVNKTIGAFRTWLEARAKGNDDAEDEASTRT
jgi:DNA-binding NarL/FixJ family response regulator